MKYLEQASSLVLKFLDELSQYRRQVLLLDVSAFTQPIEEDGQDGVAFSPPRKLVGTLIP